MVDTLIEVDDKTFEFGCSHRFCVTCSTEMLRPYIVNNELRKLVCPEASCKIKVSDEDLERLFFEEP